MKKHPSEDRINRAIRDGNAAFWSQIKLNYPEAKTDLRDFGAGEFFDAQRRAVRNWLLVNVGEHAAGIYPEKEQRIPEFSSAGVPFATTTEEREAYEQERKRTRRHNLILGVLLFLVGFGIVALFYAFNHMAP